MDSFQFDHLEIVSKNLPLKMMMMIEWPMKINMVKSLNEMNRMIVRMNVIVYYFEDRLLYRLD